MKPKYSLANLAKFKPFRFGKEDLLINARGDVAKRKDGKKEFRGHYDWAIGHFNKAAKEPADWKSINDYIEAERQKVRDFEKRASDFKPKRLKKTGQIFYINPLGDVMSGTKDHEIENQKYEGHYDLETKKFTRGGDPPKHFWPAVNRWRYDTPEVREMEEGMGTKFEPDEPMPKEEIDKIGAELAMERQLYPIMSYKAFLDKTFPKKEPKPEILEPPSPPLNFNDKEGLRKFFGNYLFLEGDEALKEFDVITIDGEDLAINVIGFVFDVDMNPRGRINPKTLEYDKTKYPGERIMKIINKP